MKFNIRKHWYFNNKNTGIELASFSGTPHIGIRVDGGKRDITICFAFFISFYLTFEGFLPNNWYPQDKSSTYGFLPGQRDLSIRFHNWSIWWTFWKDYDVWTRGDSRLRSGSFNFQNLLIGKHNCKWEEVETEQHFVIMHEGNYNVEVIKKRRIDSWQRWFTRKSISYEVKAGYYEKDGEGERWVDCPVPVEGKGENSWDCDEDATYSMTFPGKRKNHYIPNCFHAALYFEQSMRKDRNRRGGKHWLPKAFNEDDFKVILKTT